jgi:hypothetical protein
VRVDRSQARKHELGQTLQLIGAITEAEYQADRLGVEPPRDER